MVSKQLRQSLLHHCTAHPSGKAYPKMTSHQVKLAERDSFDRQLSIIGIPHVSLLRAKRKNVCDCRFVAIVAIIVKNYNFAKLSVEKKIGIPVYN
jgi:hypothetical protein